MNKVEGPIVWNALERGVPDDPNYDGNRYSRYRKVQGENGYFYLGSNYETFVLRGGFGISGGIGYWDLVKVAPVMNNGVLTGMVANEMTMSGPTVDLRNAKLDIDASAGTWTNGRYSVKLVIQSEGSDKVRVCWDAHLPPPEPITGPGEPIIRVADFRRLMCGIYAKNNIGPDLGGHVSDDTNGKILTVRGSW